MLTLLPPTVCPAPPETSTSGYEAVPDNADRVLSALERFGALLLDLKREDLTRAGTVFQIGQPPSRIDILSSISGVTFEDAWPRRILVDIEGIAVPVLARRDFIANKRAVGRPKDLSDLALLAEAVGSLDEPE